MAFNISRNPCQHLMLIDFEQERQFYFAIRPDISNEGGQDHLVFTYLLFTAPVNHNNHVIEMS